MTYRVKLATLVAAALLGAGCAHDAGYTEYYATEAPPPPPPQVEVVGVAPYPGAVWIQGHYVYSGRRHVWHPGQWTRGRPGMRYVQHSWRRTPDGRYRYRQGHWRR